MDLFFNIVLQRNSAHCAALRLILPNGLVYFISSAKQCWLKIFKRSSLDMFANSFIFSLNLFLCNF